MCQNPKNRSNSRSSIIVLYTAAVACMVSAFGRVWIKRVRLSIPLVASSTGKMFFFSCPRSRLRVWSRETGSDISFSTLGLNLLMSLVLTRGIPPAFRDGVHLFLPSTAIGSIPSYQVTRLRTNDVHCREFSSPNWSSRQSA